MPLSIKASFDKQQLKALKPKRLKGGMSKTLRRAKGSSLRAMKSDASKRIRKRKRLKVKAVNKAMKIVDRKAREIEDLAWGIRMRGDRFRLVDYPHRQIKKGVSAAVNKGKRTFVKGAFVATMPKPRKKGGGFGKPHKGVFRRLGKKRLKIRELLASRPVDALLHKGEAQAVRDRGRDEFVKTALRNLANDLKG